MNILDQVATDNLFRPDSTLQVFLLQLAKKLRDEEQIDWYIRYAQRDVVALLSAYRNVAGLPIAERVKHFRSFIINNPAP